MRLVVESTKGGSPFNSLNLNLCLAQSMDVPVTARAIVILIVLAIEQIK